MTWTSSQTAVRKIRVLLADGKRRLTVSADQPIAVVDGTGSTHTLAAGSTKFTTALPYPAPLTLSASHGTTLTLGNAYRGKLVISLVNNLALLQGDRGAWRAAEPLLARAQAIEEEALGRDSPELIATLENRAAVLERLDRRDEAAAARQRAAAIRVANAGGQP